MGECGLNNVRTGSGVSALCEEMVASENKQVIKNKEKQMQASKQESVCKFKKTLWFRVTPIPMQLVVLQTTNKANVVIN